MQPALKYKTEVEVTRIDKGASLLFQGKRFYSPSRLPYILTLFWDKPVLVRFLGAKSFNQLVILSSCLFTNLTFCQLAIQLPHHLSTCQFVNLALYYFVIRQLVICQLASLSTWHYITLSFVNFPVCQLAILSSCLFINLTFCQLGILYIRQGSK